MDRLSMFALNMRLLIGILVALLLVAIVLVFSWTGLRVWLYRRSVRASEDAEQRRRFRPDGTPYPPLAEGICDKCGEVGNQVFHLPDGGRLCRDCYDATS